MNIETSGNIKLPHNSSKLSDFAIYYVNFWQSVLTIIADYFNIVLDCHIQCSSL